MRPRTRRVPAAEKLGSYTGEATRNKVVAALEEILKVQFIDGGDLDWRSDDYVQHLHKEDNNIRRWHYDGSWPDFPYALIVWSNREPTEIIDHDTGLELKFEPGDFILIRNRRCRHRSPQEPSKDRCFLRVWNPPIRGLRERKSLKTTAD